MTHDRKTVIDVFKALPLSGISGQHVDINWQHSSEEVNSITFPFKATQLCSHTVTETKYL